MRLDGGLAFETPSAFKYWDEETGLHYNRYRYYDPLSGRFVSGDPIKLSGGFNLHLFAPSPIGWVDPLGLQAGKRRKHPESKMETTKKVGSISTSGISQETHPMALATFLHRVQQERKFNVFVSCLCKKDREPAILLEQFKHMKKERP
ncbi:RHS repeat-associated core domain-containing protein [Variovorax guangxiensis]|uniref:RHS repeat-associated core domain-containing protein n=1 Tax=Variovorax guangxiensis TaxID=1775474 RepID=UPI001F0C92CA|nr:RHS repeat-associated core domain-containing protein [Variovorax guangxiensis]